MSETTTDLPESDEVIEGFVDENDRQIAYRAEAHPTQAHSSARPAVVQNTGSTGRRKEAVARVRLLPGSGK